MGFFDDITEWENLRDKDNGIFAGQAEREWEEEVKEKRGDIL